MSSLSYYYSSMNAGKSLYLMKSYYDFVHYKEDGSVDDSNIICLTSALDDRKGEGKIFSRPINKTLDAYAVNNTDEVLDIISHHMKTINNEINLILVDEAQFFTKEQIKEFCYIVDELEINVMCFGLRTNFKGELFEGSAALLALSDKIREVKNKCSHNGCHKKATMTARVDENGKKIRDGKEIETGTEDKYISLCRRCYSNIG